MNATASSRRPAIEEATPSAAGNQMAPCHCWICRGRPPLPAAPGRPVRYIHEEGGAPPPAEAPPPRPRAAPTLDERIAAIEARTDIGAGMKSMQIRNLRARACK